MTQGPLIVDLDGTLIKTDLLLETGSSYLVSQPHHIFRLLAWFFEGKSALKTHLSHVAQIDATALPYNQDLLTWLHEEKAQGRRIVLATASHRVFVLTQ